MTPRSLPAVITAMLAVIPEGETRLRTRLTSVRHSAEFTPPEMMPVRWRTASDVLVDEVGEPSPGWQMEMARIFAGPLLEEVAP